VLIEALPAGSLYWEARATDEEMAAAAGTPAEDGAPYRPRFAGWSPEVELLAAVFDAVQNLAQVLAGGTSTPYPRPETAMERLQARRKAQATVAIDNFLMAAFAPHLTSDGG